MITRIRTVKPELFLHEELWELEYETELPIRLTFIGLFLVADREGRFEWRPRTIKALLFPYDDTPVGEIMDHLFAHDFVRRYSADGKVYGYIPTWHEHQRVNHREAASKIPDPSEGEEDDPDLVMSSPGGASEEDEPGVQLQLHTDKPPPPLVGTKGNLVEERVGQIRQARSKKDEREMMIDAFIEVVFLYWREMMGKTGRTVLDRKRKKRIRARLLENDGDVNELLCAIDGAAADDFLMGRDPRSEGKAYDGIETLFRDRGQIEKLAPMSKYYGREVHPFMEARSE